MKSKLTLENEIRWSRRVLTPAEAVKYIDATGYCMLFPVNKVPLPSLYCAVTRRNPHIDFVWDKHCTMLWRWKDELPRRRRAFYAKYFRGRGTFISVKMLPHFLAMRETAVAPGDHEHLYAEGRIRDDARVIWEALEAHGPLATLELRHACKMGTKAGNIRFKRAVLDLQCLLIVVHFGAEQETAAWASGRYELTCRAFPKETSLAREIAPEAARRKLAAKFAEWHPDAEPRQLARLFGWTKAETLVAIQSAKSKIHK
ncbi:MAG: AlkZ-related protein [Candidatus Acidiferrales bacterium]